MLQLFKRHRELKASATGGVISQLVANSIIYTPRNYDTYAKEGYQSNVIAYRCINEISGAIASLDWYLTTKSGQIIESHDMLDVMMNPNNREGWQDFIRNIIMHYYISGNAYVEAQTGDVTRIAPPTELHCLRADRMRIEADSDGEPRRYVYEAGNRLYFPARAQFKQGRWLGVIKHLKEPHPTNDWYGLSLLEPIAFEIDRFNEAAKFNAALLQNSAMPSGVLSWQEVQPTADAMDAIKQALYEEYASPANAGKPMVLSGKISWQQLGISPKELHLNETLMQAAQDICNGLGVPPELLLPIKSTHNNMSEARQIFYENTVLPLADKIKQSLLNNWLSKFYPDTPIAHYNKDGITALSGIRHKQHDTARQNWLAGIASLNETRECLQMETVTGGENVFYGQPSAELNVTEQRGVNTQMLEIKARSLLDPDVIAGEVSNPAIRTSSDEQIKLLFARLAAMFGDEFLSEAGLSLAMRQSAHLDHWISNHTAQLITQVDGTTKNMVKGAVAVGLERRDTIASIKQRIEGVFTGFKGWRAQMIATTETTAVMGESQLVAAKQAGIDKLEWLAVIDGATRDQHVGVDGKVVSVGTPFVLSDGDSGLRPGGFSRAENNINCRCAIAAAFDGEQRSYDERRMAWKRMDVSRSRAEGEFNALFRQIFDQQQQAILKRIDDVTQ